VPEAADGVIAAVARGRRRGDTPDSDDLGLMARERATARELIESLYREDYDRYLRGDARLARLLAWQGVDEHGSRLVGGLLLLEAQKHVASELGVREADLVAQLLLARSAMPATLRRQVVFD
jgi:hypothetical protein